MLVWYGSVHSTPSTPRFCLKHVLHDPFHDANHRPAKVDQGAVLLIDLRLGFLVCLQGLAEDPASRRVLGLLAG